MEAEQKKIIDTLIAENKGKRKFTQSVELIVNFRGIDFTKVDNRLNLSIPLPYGKGKESKVAIIADDQNIVEKANSLNAKVIRSSELTEFSKNSSKQTELLNYELLAQPSLMPQIAKVLGQFLGPRNKMPKPITGNIEEAVKNIGSSINVRSKGKYLPTIHCMVGKENMDSDKITANIDSVLNEIIKKVGKHSVRSSYVKFTMSKPIKII